MPRTRFEVMQEVRDKLLSGVALVVVLIIAGFVREPLSSYWARGGMWPLGPSTQERQFSELSRNIANRHPSSLTELESILRSADMRPGGAGSWFSSSWAGQLLAIADTEGSSIELDYSPKWHRKLAPAFSLLGANADTVRMGRWEPHRFVIVQLKPQVVSEYAYVGSCTATDRLVLSLPEGRLVAISRTLKWVQIVE